MGISQIIFVDLPYLCPKYDRIPYYHSAALNLFSVLYFCRNLLLPEILREVLYET